MLSINGRYPLRLTPIDSTEIDGLADRYTQSNHRILRALNLLQLGGRVDAPEVSGDSSNEIARIDAKLDMVLQLLGDFLMSQQSLPDAQYVELGTQQILVCSDDKLIAGALVQIDIYTNLRFPQPLTFLCEYTGEADTLAGNSLRFDLREVDDVVRDELERYIFLLQRHTRGVSLNK